ncbi:hypothetical protein ACFE04_009971 [Oxalis oulophora]
MGSIIMEPDDIATYLQQGIIPETNLSAICISTGKINSSGFFNQSFFLDYSVPLLLLQITLSSGIILLLYQLLKNLGQTLIVAQILGGVILGPSVLGQIQLFDRTIFPLHSLVTLDAVSTFGYMFYFFVIGIPVDPTVVKKIDKQALAIGFSTVATPTVLGTLFVSFLMNNFVLEPKTANSLPVIAQLESVLSFPVIAHFLCELGIINSEFGHVALSASLVSMLTSFCIITTSVLMHQSAGESSMILKTMGNAIGLAVAIVAIIRPTVSWMMKRSSKGEPLKQGYVVTLCLAVVISGFCSHALGLHMYYGPLILGIAMPPGPPIGSTMIDKLEYFTFWFFMPLFFLKTGLGMNIYAVKWKNYLAVQSVALVSVLGKFLGAFLSSIFCKIPIKHGMALGLVMNFQGVLELGLFKMMKRNKAIDNGSFVIMCMSLVIVTSIITPVIRCLYDPSKRYVVYKRRTVMHSRPHTELRVVVCIHDQENVPTIINILEALNPTKRSPLSVNILHLVELVGRTNPLVISHKVTKRKSSEATSSEHVVNAFMYFEQSNYGQVTIFPFTVIAPPKTMHDDVCRIALDKRVSLIILPFHKTFIANGASMPYKKVSKITNNNILSNAPCSVGILVDRGFLNSSKPIYDSGSSYHVAILFLGGADDREALAIGARMARHPHINLTVIRLLENGTISSDGTINSKLDNDMVSEFRNTVAGNYRVMYIEEAVADGGGTISVIRQMANIYKLILVGRNHDYPSTLLMGLTDWNEHVELGIIGELLATADFMSNTSVLVVQQQQQYADLENEKDHDTSSWDPDNIRESQHLPIQRHTSEDI